METMTPEASQKLIREKVKAGIDKRATLKPYALKTPVQLDVTFKNYKPAEILAYLPFVQRTTAHSIRFMGKDIIEVSKFIEFLGTYEPGLAP